MIRSRTMQGLAPVLLVVAFGCGGSNQPAATPAPAAPSAAASAPPPAASVAAAPAAPAASAVPDTGAAGPVATDAEEDESMADVKEHHRHHHHGGFAMFVAMSLDSLGTTPEQAAQIAKIQTELREKMKPAREAEKTVLVTIADGVAAGKVAPAKVDAAIAKLSTAAAAVHDSVADTMNQLHALLTPAQRAALVDKVEAHFEVWHEANAAEEPKERDEHGGHLGHLAKELSLTPDQVEKIRTQFTTTIGTAPKYDRAEADAHLKAWGDAFASDNFDSKAITTGGAANAHIATWGATRMAHFYEAVAPVLTKDQRAKLAESLRKHANYKPNTTNT